jgi:hypothetical protein
MSYEAKTNGPFNEKHEPLQRDLSNKHRVLDFVEAIADKFRARHLCHSEFCQICTSAPADDKMAILAARKQSEAAEAANIKAEAAAAEDVNVEDVKAETEDNYNYGFGTPRKGGQKQVKQGSMPTPVRPGEMGATYFADPTLCETGKFDVAEHHKDRTLRIAFWMMMVALLVNFQELIQPIVRYDTAALYRSINTLCFGRGVADVLDSITGMTLLKKTRELSWAKFQGQVVKLRNDLGRITNPFLQMGERVLVEFVMRAIDSDAAFAVELALCRKDLSITLEQVLKTMTAVARTVEGPIGVLDLPSEAQVYFSKATTDSACFNWVKYGDCPFSKEGGKCRYSHAGPKGTKVRSASNSDRNGTGGALCPVCNKTDHVLDTCPRMLKLAKMEEAELRKGGGDDEKMGDLAANVAIWGASDGVYGGAFGYGEIDTEFLDTVRRINDAAQLD